MSNYNFCYNYGFLADWFRANPNIMRKEVLANLNMIDYNSLKNWIDGITMMPTNQMMRFCNLYNVPMTAFFLDENAQDDSVFAPIMVDSMIEPAGGWPNSTRRAGIKVCDPRTRVHYVSNLPEYVKPATTSKAEKKEDEHEGTEAEGRMSDETQTGHASEYGWRKQYHEERMRYLDIISKMNEQIARLTQENIALQKKAYSAKGNGYMMVAEDDNI